MHAVSSRSTTKLNSQIDSALLPNLGNGLCKKTLREIQAPPTGIFSEEPSTSHWYI